jgi:tRNA pseudouridine55 synthase
VLGQTTDTDDSDGSVLLERPVPAISREQLEAALAPLKGRIRQRAPIYSALKQGGEPLYMKARRGETIEAPERDVEVHAIEVLDQQPTRLSLRVTCGSGTYIRSLARDLGETLGCGAHIAGLRRLWVDPFREAPMVTLDTLRELAGQGDETALEALLLPLAAGLADYPRVDLDAEQAPRFSVGQRLRNPAWGAGTVAVYGPNGPILGLGEVDETGRLSPQRCFNL